MMRECDECGSVFCELDRCTVHCTQCRDRGYYYTLSGDREGRVECELCCELGYERDTDPRVEWPE